jgi:hypothetical protein
LLSDTQSGLVALKARPHGFSMVGSVITAPALAWSATRLVWWNSLPAGGPDGWLAGAATAATLAAVKALTVSAVSVPSRNNLGTKVPFPDGKAIVG